MKILKAKGVSCKRDGWQDCLERQFAPHRRYQLSFGAFQKIDPEDDTQ